MPSPDRSSFMPVCGEFPGGRAGQSPADGKVTAMVTREVGVVGLGTMGAGIAEVFARGGLSVTAVEADRDALARGMSILGSSLGRAVSRGKLTEDEQEQILGRVRPGSAMKSLSGADLVIEVVPEQLAVKRQVLAEDRKSTRLNSSHSQISYAV